MIKVPQLARFAGQSFSSVTFRWQSSAYLLRAITDVTEMRAEARLKDDLVRDKAILLQEMQHRVANSLQIIASVLMQSARRVQSEEARGHLHDARHRIMSIAALQRQLSTSAGGSVELRAYFTQLCQSLGASMIADPERLSIKVTVDDSSVAAGVSIRLERVRFTRGHIRRI